MKSNDGIPCPHGSENEGTCFLGYSLTKNIPRKKQHEFQVSTLRCSEKQVLLKRIKTAIKSVF